MYEESISEAIEIQKGIREANLAKAIEDAVLTPEINHKPTLYYILDQIHKLETQITFLKIRQLKHALRDT